MPRRCKHRRVAFTPDVTYFKPSGLPLRSLEDVQVSIEELEAIRLKDLEGLEQEECAKRMNISRPTFQRVLGSARQKIADALLKGKAMRIGGGNFELAIRRFRCLHGHEWDVPVEDTNGEHPRFCPTCNSYEIQPIKPGGD